jgi:hypothetical protein
LSKLLDGHQISAANHFIQKEVVAINTHFPADGLITTKPRIGLFGNRGVKIPMLVPLT